MSDEADILVLNEALANITSRINVLKSIPNRSNLEEEELKMWIYWGYEDL